ncbi:serine hydrolase domain-containing protein [Pseudomonas gingeri]|uniref:serine hydrolase domain-containing protein n=1 Tax=Pseudomonas gingeri TaxID=117681 RepID=UPI0015A12DB1|nr:serine hydrolase domain-containing protein [Pseudomonas gingeri]NWD06460.1 beta-lactamase family protein [Pseudomonas gingeri]NWE32958.1 beta-lactamase family protein [Pseudomonas gingeri]NWE55704.1 beta-lactamase family protein [Pseudomonas gingeri]NWF03807.1 beta-lactamase family protein [Pseudomonas gingeri]
MFRSLRTLPLISFLLGSMGCNGQPPAPTPPLEKGDYSSIIRYLQAQIPEEMAERKVPGLSIALVAGQETIWARGFGYADKEDGVRVTDHTAFRAGSISKLLTATAALQLVEQRRLALDAPLQDTLKEFYVRSRFHEHQQDADKAVTLRRLLSHQSGLPGEYLRDLRTPSALDQLPQRVSGLWLSNPPGRQVAYSNLGYALAGAAIERSSGETFENQLQKTLLKPLEMTQSSFIGDGDRQPFRAQGYQGGSPRPDTEIRDLSAGGLWASPRDLSHYVQMLFADGTYKGRRILEAQSVQEMFRQQNRGNALDFDCQMGLGWFLAPCGDEVVAPGVRTFQHSGASGDFVAQVSLLPDQQLAVIVMANSDTSAELVASLTTRSLRMMLQAYAGQSTCTEACEEESTVAAGTRTIPSDIDRQRVEGFYATPSGVLRIRQERQRLYADLAGNRFELLRDEQGWLRAEKKLLGFWPVDLGELGRLQMDVTTVQGRQILTARSHGQLMPLGERIEPVPLPRGWLNTVGEYQVINSDEPEAALSGVSIRVEDGFLLMRGRINEQELTEFILTPIDNAHAVLAGNGLGLGDTVSRQVLGISALGYRFKRAAESSPSLIF